jgi:hypothetical protein
MSGANAKRTVAELARTILGDDFRQHDLTDAQVKRRTVEIALGDQAKGQPEPYIDAAFATLTDNPDLAIEPRERARRYAEEERRQSGGQGGAQ